jgi:hypothetical protein
VGRRGRQPVRGGHLDHPAFVDRAARVTAPAPAARGLRGVDLYYLVGTPVFAALDHFAGISVRAAFLDGWPAARYGYYGICFGCGLAGWRLPARARGIALTESTANIVLLIFSVMLGYYATIDQVANEQIVTITHGPSYAINLVLATGALMFSYFRSLR